MKYTRKRPHGLVSSIAAAMIVLCAAGAIGADQTLESYVPKGYDFTARIDVRQALDSEVLAPLRDALLNDQVQAVVDAIYAMSNIDLLEDLNTILLAGKFDKTEDKGVFVIAQGNLDERGVASIFQMQPQFEKIPVGPKTLYGFWAQDDQKMQYFGFLEKDVMAFGSKEAVKAALSSDGAPGSRMADNPAYSQMVAAAPAGALLSFIANVPPDLPADNPVGTALLRSAKTVCASVVLAEQVNVTIDLAVANARDALLWRDLGTGALALAQMIKEFPQFTKFAERVTLTVQETHVRASAAASMKEILSLLAMQPDIRKLLEAASAQGGQPG